MNEDQLKTLLQDIKRVEERITAHLEKENLVTQPIDKDEIQGHIEKSEHNLRFTQNTLENGFSDWGIVGCYYAAYHVALALTLKQGFSSKSHDATLCILIKYYYRTMLSEEDFKLLNEFYLDNEDVLFYIQSKQEREKASYSTEKAFDKKSVNELRLKTILFVNKCKEILKQPP